MSTSERVRTIGMTAAVLTWAAGCPAGDKPKGDGTFKDLRAFLAAKSEPEGAEWQAAEARITALTVAGQGARAAAAVEEAAGILRRWAEALEGAPAPLPIKAPLAALRKALAALSAIRETGAAREKALDDVEAAVQDLSLRNVIVAPHIGKPGAAVDAGDYLHTLWRDVRGLETLPEGGGPGAQGGLGDGGPDDGAGGAAAEEAATTDPLAEMAALAREAQATAATPGDRLAHGLAVQLLAAGDAYRRNPPKIDGRTAMLFQMGRIGRDQIDAAICAAARPLAGRLAAVQQLADAVARTCAAPGAGCTPAAADLAFHPLLAEIAAVGAKAAQCAAPPDPAALEGEPAAPGAPPGP